MAFHIAFGALFNISIIRKRDKGNQPDFLIQVFFQSKLF